MSFSRSAHFWLGLLIPRSTSLVVEQQQLLLSRSLTTFTVFTGTAAGALFIFSRFHDQDMTTSSSVLPLASLTVSYALDLLYDTLIPFLAVLAFLVACTLLLRRLLVDTTTYVRRYCAGAHPAISISSFSSSPPPPSPSSSSSSSSYSSSLTRSTSLVAGTSVLFAFSCAYRALNIADEGAAACRSLPSLFNAPASGRTVATVGEISLVYQLSVYMHETANRLGVTSSLSSSLIRRLTTIPFTTIAPVLLAECMSWSGVLSGVSKFYCVEYVLWMVVALSWAWDGAALLGHTPQRFGDRLVHAGIMLAGLALFAFNALFEIPHFFSYQRDPTVANQQVLPTGIWECYQQHDSPLWWKRLPFFFCYFIGCAWASVALTYRFVFAATYHRRTASTRHLLKTVTPLSDAPYCEIDDNSATTNKKER